MAVPDRDPMLAKLRQDLHIDANLLGYDLQFKTTWGLFSPRGIDEGSELLLEHLQVAKDETALDFGCGYGPIGLAIAAAAPEGSVQLIDKDFVAIDYANTNATLNKLPNARAYLSNALMGVPTERAFSLVVSNLPAKTGNELYTLAFNDAKDRMLPGGKIVVVTINGLRSYMKRSFTEIFGNYKKLKQGKTYTVSAAERLPD
jgi:16S rRNA (guanine1207-N2)-methyltransferase